MYCDQINKEQLSQTAQELLNLLEKYQITNDDAKNILKRSRNLLVSAVNKEIDKPLSEGFTPEEFISDKLSGLIELEVAISKFDLLLTGVKSLEDVSKATQEALNQAELDEMELRNKLK